MQWNTLVRPGDSFDHWHQATCRSYSRTECVRLPDARFRARIAVRELGQFTLNEISSSTGEGHPIRVERGAADIRRDPRDDFFLWFALGGRTMFEQDARAVALQAGDMVLHDQARPFTLEFPGWSHAAMVAVPRALLASRLAAPDRLVARRVPRQARLGALAGAVLRELLRMPGGPDSPAARPVAGAALDIWAAALEGELAPATPGAVRQARLADVKQYLLARLGDVDLDIETIARVHHMAPRTLARLFAAEGTTPIRWMWQQRLAASYKALAEGRVSHVKTAAIEFGFADPSHFSRAFKAEFGRAPAQVLKAR